MRMQIGQRFYNTEGGGAASGEGQGQGQGQGQAGASGSEDKGLAYWESEAKKAFKERDQERKQRRDLEQRAISEEDRALFDRLKSESDKAEEKRKREEGQFDTWRTDITRKHDEAIKSEAAKREAAETKLRQKLIGLEFAGASSLFGESGKTVLTPDIAEAYFGRYVDIVTDDQGRESVVVKGHDGHVVLDAKTGKAASFVDAMTEIIDGLPNKDRILRGSGKSGSGSSGGSTNGAGTLQYDVANLTPEQRRDPKILADLRKRRPRGGMVIGPAYDQ